MYGIFVCGFCCHVGRIVNYVTKVAAKSTSKKTSKIGILINASSLRSLTCIRDDKRQDKVQNALPEAANHAAQYALVIDALSLEYL
jgi:hypothetical protein